MGGTKSQIFKIRYLTNADAAILRAQLHGADNRYTLDTNTNRSIKKLVGLAKYLMDKGVIEFGTPEEIKIKLQVTWKTALEIASNLKGSMSHE
jgi:hypothetical protein